MSISQRYQLSKGIMVEEQRCFHPDAPSGCSPEGPIKSHSVSKGTSLAAIAENGYVTSIIRPFDEIVFEDKAAVEPSGIKASSVFPGFCKNHDNKLFSAIETDGWEPSNETCFLLSYRSLANTVLNSRIKIRYFRHMNALDEERYRLIMTEGFTDDDIIKDYDFGIFARRYLKYPGKAGTDMEINETIRSQYLSHAELRSVVGSINPYMKMARFFNDEDHLGKMAQMFLAGDYGTFRYLALRYDYALPFVASKTIKVKILSGEGMVESFTNLNVCSNKKHSFIVFGWMEDGGIVKEYLESIIISDIKRTANKVLEYLFRNPTNAFFRQSWWKGLPEEVKRSVLSYHQIETNAFPDKEQSGDDYTIVIPETLPIGRYESL